MADRPRCADAQFKPIAVNDEGDEDVDRDMDGSSMSANMLRPCGAMRQYVP